MQRKWSHSAWVAIASYDCVEGGGDKISRDGKDFFAMMMEEYDKKRKRNAARSLGFIDEWTVLTFTSNFMRSGSAMIHSIHRSTQKIHLSLLVPAADCPFTFKSET